jgi:hypothetical protein
MVKISSTTKVQIILSTILWIAGAVILLGGTAIAGKNDNAWSTVLISGMIVLFGIYSSVKKDHLAALKPQLIKKN